MSGVEDRWPVDRGPRPIGTRLPDCPDCGAQMQAVRREGAAIFRCPWVTASRYASGLIAGMTVVSCDSPLAGDRDPNGVEPYA